ncbi:hypothetical protein LG047_14555 [Methylocystis sp. WRRC1]|uniref:protealysin inhibitor emfourin n=1 Tax=Methylocystis sp. WRRC1 TaxID=1732014 RepID=UPI001D13356A|nr:protealysin inhibitor emfourin [Methylocystis sp. WRRC1]MCC3246521.1 hypothetical protein [Methylocystis sp. WRRC1]
MSPGTEKSESPSDNPAADPDKGPLLRITRLGGHLPLLKPKREVLFNTLSQVERGAIEAIFSLKTPEESVEARRPDATSYKFELEGPTTNLCVTVPGLKIPKPLSRLLP